MTAPYHLTNYGDAVYTGSLGVCLAKVREARAAGYDMRGYALTGDGADGGYDDDGLGWRDDLTDEERERFEEARGG